MSEIRQNLAAELGEAEARKVAALTNLVWPQQDATEEDLVRDLLVGDRCTREVLTIWDGGQLLAHAAIFPRRIRHTDGELEVMALAHVCVAPDRRGEGLGARIVRAAFGEVDRGRFALSLFQTGIPDFYRRLGAVPVDNPFHNRLSEHGPAARPWWSPCVMIYPRHPAWPRGPVDLNGPAY